MIAIHDSRLRSRNYALIRKPSGRRPDASGRVAALLWETSNEFEGNGMRLDGVQVQFRNKRPAPDGWAYDVYAAGEYIGVVHNKSVDVGGALGPRRHANRWRAILYGEKRLTLFQNRGAAAYGLLAEVQRLERDAARRHRRDAQLEEFRAQRQQRKA